MVLKSYNYLFDLVHFLCSTKTEHIDIDKEFDILETEFRTSINKNLYISRILEAIIDNQLVTANL